MKLTSLTLLIFTSIVHGQVLKIPGLGEIQGTTGKTSWKKREIYEYYSIRYAESPSGDRRLAPPVPVESWTGVYDATKQRRGCPSLLDLDNLRAHISSGEDLEDCLTLNVFTPLDPHKTYGNKKKLPVMIHIHGGQFVGGGAKDYPPNYLLEHDIVLVVIQYRLGALGCLSLQTDRIAGNVAFMDQLMAIQWVNKHIRHFHGNKDAVTLAGHSSGAFSVSAHLLSPMVDPGLFHRAIVKSASTYAYWGVFDDPVDFSRDLYTYLTNDTIDADIEKIQNAFINAPLIDFVTANFKKFNADSPFFMNGLTVQTAGSSKFMVEDPLRLLVEGKRRSLPMLTGVVKEDGSAFTAPFYDILAKSNLENNDHYLRNNATRAVLEYCYVHDRSDTIMNLINNDYNRELFQKRRPLNFTDLNPSITDLFGLLGFKSQVFKQAKDNALHEKTYLYTFDYRGAHTNFGKGRDPPYPFDGGVTHSNELIYLYPTYKLNKKDRRMAKIMTELFTNFIIHGHPQSNNWPELERDKNGPYIHINDRLTVGHDFIQTEYFAANNDKILNHNID